MPYILDQSPFACLKADVSSKMRTISKFASSVSVSLVLTQVALAGTLSQYADLNAQGCHLHEIHSSSLTTDAGTSIRGQLALHVAPHPQLNDTEGTLTPPLPRSMD